MPRAPILPARQAGFADDQRRRTQFVGQPDTKPVPPATDPDDLPQGAVIGHRRRPQSVETKRILNLVRCRPGGRPVLPLEPLGGSARSRDRRSNQEQKLRRDELRTCAGG